jgi:hypothetical protein
MRLLRNVEYPDKAKNEIFTLPNPCGSPVFDPTVTLDPFGPDCTAQAGEADDDDTNWLGHTTGDGEFGIVSDLSKPLAFYQIDAMLPVGNQLMLVKWPEFETVELVF